MAPSTRFGELGVARSTSVYAGIGISGFFGPRRAERRSLVASRSPPVTSISVPMSTQGREARHLVRAAPRLVAPSRSAAPSSLSLNPASSIGSPSAQSAIVVGSRVAVNRAGLWWAQLWSANQSGSSPFGFGSSSEQLQRGARMLVGQFGIPWFGPSGLQLRPRARPNPSLQRTRFARR